VVLGRDVSDEDEEVSEGVVAFSGVLGFFAPSSLSAIGSPSG